MTQNLPALFTMSDLEKMANAMVKSQLFGIKTADQAVTLMLVAQAEGMHPATAARDYHIIQNRPAMKADAMLARFQQSGGKVEWVDYTDSKVSARFSHPQSPTPVLIEWTFDMAKKIGLTGKDNWRNYPRQMLRARVVSEGVRTCYPAIATGIYTPEEVQDFAPEKDVTPTAGTFGALPVARQEVLNATASEVRALLANDQAWDAYGLLENSGFDTDERAAFWSLLDSKQRNVLGRMGEAERAKAKGVISPAQHRRLEAQIKELGLSRQEVKDQCLAKFNVTSLTQLTQEQYQELDSQLAVMASQAGAKSAAAQPRPEPSAPPSETPAAPAADPDPEQKPKSGLAFYYPGMAEPQDQAETADEWFLLWQHMCDKIVASTRMDSAEKDKKIRDLRKANHPVVKRLGAVMAAKLNADIAKRSRELKDAAMGG
jgi:hypothetical protein